MCTHVSTVFGKIREEVFLGCRSIENRSHVRDEGGVNAIGTVNGESLLCGG